MGGDPHKKLFGQVDIRIDEGSSIATTRNLSLSLRNLSLFLFYALFLSGGTMIIIMMKKTLF